MRPPTQRDEAAAAPSAHPRRPNPDPPRRSLGLSLRLGLLTALVVTGVMAVVSGAQLGLDLRAERQAQARLLRESPAPSHAARAKLDLAGEESRRWRGWALHVAITAAVTLGFLFFVVRREVTGPIDRLMRGIRKMELGYWDDMPDPGGAWEIRWLAWRFRSLGSELARTVELLVSAQRRGFAEPPDPERASGVQAPETEPGGTEPTEPTAVEATVGRLKAELARVQKTDPADALAPARAREAWDHHAPLAMRLGRGNLRNALEDAALALADPQAFEAIGARLTADRETLEALSRARSRELLAALEAGQVPVVRLSSRIKHAAGIWKKMRQKDLDFEQVHDLVALRVVVPTETDCYRALNVLHDLYAPIVSRFKDYIASPKDNGYRGLHVSARDESGRVFEVQIRSVAMDRHAEHGEAKHADYKQATSVGLDRPPVTPLGRLVERIRAAVGDRSGGSAP